MTHAPIPPIVRAVQDAARQLAHVTARPFVVALDGRSGAGKSTLATAIAEALDALVVDGDGFFAGGVALRSDSPEARARECIDWRAQRRVLEALRARESASYFAFDWNAFDGRLETAPTFLEPRNVIVLEGVYSARPELRDLIDLLVLVRANDETRIARLKERDGGVGPWEHQWHEAEAWYFTHMAPPEQFDAVVDGPA